LIESNQNTGIPGNCNRGLKELRGKIVKIIAGDDCFFEGAFEQVVEVFSKDIEIKVLQTRGCFYNDTFEENNFMHRWERSKNFDFFGMNAKKQYKTLKYRNYIFTPGMFFDSEVFKNLAFDEEFRKLEDYPFWIMLTKNNFKFYFSELITVKYIVHKDSIQNDGLEYTSNDKLLTTIKIQKKNYQSAFIILKILIKINSLELNPKLLKKIHILISRLIIYFNYIHTRII
jgi:alpha-1,3-rhamnosyltransferase